MSTIRRLFARDPGPPDPNRFWSERSRRLGARAVLDLRDPADRIEDVTEMQRRELYPRLRAQLEGCEERLLDFGCGPARFTTELAALVGGRAIGLDICRELLDLAPRAATVDYLRMGPGRIPLATDSVDVAWVCLVLGGIVDADLLTATAAEIDRVLAPGGLIFLAENTTPGTGPRHWAFRSVDDYRALFAPRTLEHLGDYDHAGERISILGGRGSA